MNLKEIRTKHNLSQQKVAEIIGVSRPTVIKIEKEKRNLSPEEKNSLSRFIGEPQTNPTIDYRIMDFIREYPDVSITLMENILETLQDYRLFNSKGDEFREEFWKTFIKL